MTEKIRGDIMEPSNIVTEDTGIYPETKIINEKLEWFENQKIGVIFHWGLYAQAGIVESWQLSEEDEWAREPVAWREDVKELQRDYWNLIEEFSPSDFHPKEWAELCKEAGFKYMIFTTKHHDGFHMYNTQESDYKIGGSRSPYNRDIFKGVVEAFRNEGIAIGAYYSKADWYSPYYWVDNGAVKGRRANYDTAQEAELWEKYVQYVHRELEEITQNYGKVDILWLDAGWCGQGKEDLRMDEIAEKVRKNTPDLLMVDRMMGGRHENYVTPERRIPMAEEIPHKTWESNIPLARNWGFVPNDQYKSSREIILNVIDVVTKGGNILLGIGPTAEGAFTEESKVILKDLGQWLLKNGEGIYGTRAIKKIQEDREWYMTCKGNNYYGFYIVRSSDEQLMKLKFSKDNIDGKSIKSVSTLDEKQYFNFEILENNNYLFTIPKREYYCGIVPIKIKVK